MKSLRPVAIFAGLLLASLWLLPQVSSKAASDHVGTSQVVLRTTGGDITIALRADWAPTAVAVFSRNCCRGTFDGTILHVAWDHVVGGGKYEPDGSLRTSPAVAPDREIGTGIEWSRGRIAFRPFPTTTGLADSSEFIIALGDYGATTPLTVFGEIVDGIEIVDALAASEIEGEIPAIPIIVESVELQAP